MESTPFIQTISQGLALEPKQARAAIGIMVGFVVQHASPETSKQLLAALPLTHSLLGADRVPPMTSDQMKIPGIQGPDDLDPPHFLGLSGALGEVGVSSDQTYVIVMRLLDFIAKVEGDELALKILEEVPDLDPLAGSPVSGGQQQETPPQGERCPELDGVLWPI